MEGKKIVITGGCGFIGSALVRRLAEKNDVLVIDNLVAGVQSNIPHRVQLLNIDLADEKNAATLCGALENVDIVYHLAAEPYIPKSYDHPHVFFRTNVTGTINVFKAALEAGVERVVLYSSSEVYGSADIPITEDMQLNPMSTYAVSKMAQDRLAYTWFHEHKLPVVILRQFNCYGPRETHPYVIPEIIRQAKLGKAVQLGNLHTYRDFLYVEDAAEAAELAGEYAWDMFGQAFNVGFGATFHLEYDILRTLKDVMGDFEVTSVESRKRPLDVIHLHANTQKFMKMTGWKGPSVGLADGLRMTVEWYKQNGMWSYEMGLLK